MGIDGLNKLFERHSQNSNISCRVSQLTGYRIAIEMGCLMYAHMSPSFNRVVNQTDIITYGIDQKQVFVNWAKSILSALSKFLRLGVTPVLVFDGPPRPEKIKTVTKRADDKKPRMQLAQEKLQALRQKNILAVTPLELKELRTLWQNCYYVSHDLVSQLKNMCYCLGFPVLQAKYDAEQLCASLAIDGLVLGTYTNDTDAYTFGTPWVYSKMESIDNGDLMLQARNLNTILSDLQMTQSSFVDMCILAGCDYNTKPDKYRVSSLTSFKEMKKYGEHTKMPNKFHQEELNIDCCRRIFSYVKPEDFTDDKIVVDVQPNNITDLTDALMAEYDMMDYKTMIVTHLNSIKSSSSVPPSDNLKYVPPRKKPGFILIFEDESSLAASSSGGNSSTIH